VKPRVVLVDHKDSFAFILGEQFAVAGAEVATVRCTVPLDEFAAWLAAQDPHLVVLSPGPGAPRDTGLTLPWLATDPRVPILGVCLGLQAMVEAGGGRVGHAPQPVHGRASDVRWVGAADADEQPLVAAARAAMAPSVRAARYHSLAVLDAGPEHRVLAETSDRPAVIMAVSHRRRPRLGLQFHPESVLTPRGAGLLSGVLRAAVAHDTQRS